MSKKGAKNIHHRKCVSNGGSNHRDNLSLVCVKQHESFHRLFQNYTPEVIAEILNETWIDPSKKFVCVPKEYAEATALFVENMIKRGE